MRTIKSYLLLVIFILVVSNSLSGVIAVNHLEEVFPPPPTGGEESLYSTNILSDLIVDATSFFMKSYSSANLMLYEVEKAEKGYFDLLNSIIYVNDSIRLLKLSRVNYYRVIEIVRDLEYIEDKINCLKSFDYMRFARDNNLITEIMEKVAECFSRGDVKGFYGRNLENIDSILSILYSIRRELNNGIKPDIPLYWNLLQSYSNAALFGNYATASAKEAFSKE